MNKLLEDKCKKLRTLLKQKDKVIIAFSGGLDSVFLLKMAVETLGNKNVVAVTALSASIPMEELKEAKTFAQSLDVMHHIIKTNEFDNKRFLLNSQKRCFYCKNEFFLKIRKLAKSIRIKHILYGAIADDEKDIRPGMTAAKKHKIEAPLQEARFKKSEIRECLKNIPISKKPSTPCLASRIPFRQIITKSKIQRVYRSEKVLRELGFKIVRVRHHDDIARIEIDESEIPKFIKRELREIITKRLKKLGFIYITLDLQGYRQGSLHEAEKS